MFCKYRMYILLILMTVSYSVRAGWSINTSSHNNPLQFGFNSESLDILDGITPVFENDLYPTQISLNATYVDANGYRIFNCTAQNGVNSCQYLIKLKVLDTFSVELLLNGISGNIERFECGNITGSAGQFKQFYTGERYTDIYSGNNRVPPILYWQDQDIYFYGFWDKDVSNGVTAFHRQNPKTIFLSDEPPFTCDVEYGVLSDGSVPLLNERYLLKYSYELWDAYQPLPNSASAFAQELSGMLLFDQWGGSGFDYGRFVLEWLEDVAGGHLDFYTVCHGWSSLGFDVSNPDYYQRGLHDEPMAWYGNIEDLQNYIEQGKESGRIALHCNYMMAADESWSLVQGDIKRAINSAGEPAWYTNMASVLPLVQRQESEIFQDLQTNGLFHDQSASGTVINYDIQMDGAGTISQARALIRQVCSSAKGVNNVPLFSESLAVEHLLGEYVDGGDMSIMNGYNRYDFSPEYKLRRLHKLSAFHSVGLAYRHYYDSTESERVYLGNQAYFNDDQKLDSYRACEILYGNGAYLFSFPTEISTLRKVHALTECFTVGVLQKYYLLQTLDYVLYGKAGMWKTLPQVIEASTSVEEMRSWYKQFHIRYTNGCNVWVNRDAEEMEVSLPDGTTIVLPQNGWTVYTEDGQVVGYTALYNDSRVDFCEDKNRAIMYINPRDAGLFKRTLRATVWIDGQKHFELDEPDATLLASFHNAKSDIHGVEKGDILSWFSTEQTSPYGIDLEGISTTTLHIIDESAQVHSYVVNDMLELSDGGEGYYEAENRMTSQQSQSGYRGLSLAKTYQGSGLKYISSKSNQELYRSVFDYPDEPGQMEWIKNTAAGEIRTTGDICPTARGKADGAWPVVWTVYSGYGDSGFENAVYRYPDTPWTTGSQYTARFEMPKLLQGITLAEDDYLWVLCRDGEVLKISSVDGAIVERFYIAGSIYSPSGIACDLKGRLWITDRNEAKVYQIAIKNGTTRYFDADINQDFYVNIEDLNLFVSDWLHNE